MTTRTLRIGCEFVHQSRYDVPSVFQVEPLGDQQAELVESSWSFDPNLVSTTYSDLYGNLCRRLTIPAGRSVISYDATTSPAPTMVAPATAAPDPSVLEGDDPLTGIGDPPRPTV